MKKILLSTVFVASSWMLFAQEDKTNRTNNMNNTNTTTNQQLNTSTNQNTSDPMYNTTTTSSYSAYGIPNYVQMNFQTQYPAVSNLTWTAPTADWYHGYFSDNAGRYTHVYYSTDPYYNVQYYPERVVSYTVSLPVLQTYVPDAVITTASNLYRHNLYDIAAMRGNNDQEMYLVRVFDNGELKSMWMDANGTAVTDVWRTEEDMNLNNTTDVNIETSTDTNPAKSKTKTEYSDGTEIKTKTKNGKTKTKVDD